MNNDLFSYFGGITTDNHKIGDLTIEQLYEIVKSDKYADIVKRIRELQGEDNKVERSEYKKKLDYFIATGTYSKRGNEHIITPSKYICIDFDHITKNNNAEGWREFLSKDFCDMGARLVFLSPSGDGFKVIFEVVEGSFSDDASYKKVFTKLALRLNSRLWRCPDDRPYRWLIEKDGEDGIDMASAIAQACFMSYDPNAVLCNDYMPFDPDIVSDDEYNDYLHRNTGKETKVAPMPQHSFQISTTEAEEIEFYAQKVIASYTDTTSGYWDWFAWACLLHKCPNGLSLFLQISSFNEDYNEREATKKFNSCHEGEYGICWLMDKVIKPNFPYSEWAREYYLEHKKPRNMTTGSPKNGPNFTQGSRKDIEYQTAKNIANSEEIAQESFWDEYKKQKFDDAYYHEQFERMGEGLKTGYCVKGEDGDVPIAFPCEGIDFISGISGHGKTALICNIILNILHDNPTKRVVYFAYEESEMKIIARFANINLCGKCSIPEKNNQQMIELYLKNKKTDFMKNKDEDVAIGLIEEIKRLVSENRLIIVRKNKFEDVNNLLPEIQNIPKAWNNEVCAIFIDHMGKLYENPKADRYMDIDHICGKLNDWSIDNKVPVIVAVQFNKEVKNITTMTSQNIAEAWKITNNANYTLAIWNLSRQPIEKDPEGSPTWGYGSAACVLKVLKDRSGFIQEGQYATPKMDGYTKRIERNDGITNHKLDYIESSYTNYQWQK